MTAKEIRRSFLDFFISKQHKIVPSSPIVNKDDPTLMFTNAGMNQFKDFFLGNQVPDVRRIADTQKCLRVSGKHNDLEEVGRDGTHHTMFEMLGNWSFGDYFKKEAIEWSWELLTKVYGLPADRLYATIFEGAADEGLAPDTDAKNLWLNWLPENHIINGNKKDNFWEMGEQGPCGPCTEIHIDMRPDEDRAKLDGAGLVNKDHPLVVEIWNNVFIQFNRKADKSLEELPEKHVDTGMGFERLTMVLQGKTATYDTDIFTPIINFVEKESGIKYTGKYPDDPNARPPADMMSDIAMRVVADHIRAVTFAVADGQLPGNTGAGYVIRRILRRAVRYYYSFLNIKKPFLYRLLPMLSDMFGEVFPEVKAQELQLLKIIQGEEKAFLNTLENGLKRFADLQVINNIIDGKEAFTLYDTFGFPIDLTRLMAEEKGWTVDEKGFEKAMKVQKDQAKEDAVKETSDWQILVEAGSDVEFVGYDDLTVEDAQVLRHRTVVAKKKKRFEVVLSRTPFYAESGGQHGDKGWMQFGQERVKVIDTQKENDLIIQVLDKLPSDLSGKVMASVDPSKRQSTSSNHSAVHLMHAALHRVLGENALQKGQDVDSKRLRFDFSHFQKMTDKELRQVEKMVNEKIRENIALEEVRHMPIEEAKNSGAMMLFGEKYGETVRVITFDKNFSRELCGGTHVQATGEIGLFKILSETGVAAGIRRIEAVTAEKAEAYLLSELDGLNEIRSILKGAQDPVKAVATLQEENKNLKKQVEQLLAEQANALKGQLKSQFEARNGVNFLAAKLPLQDANAIKTLAYQLEHEVGNACIVFGAEVKGKPQLTVAVSKELTDKLNAGTMVRELAKEIKGGGGGQPFFATAGGKDVEGLERAVERAKELV